MAELHRAFGHAQSASLKLPRERTTLTSKNFGAEISISARSYRVASSVRAALEPDLGRLPKSDGRASISTTGTDVIFRIEAPDVPTLRAGVHSLLLLADASLRCLTL
ncbi:MAG: KEOPS complex subunit Pcc1 [Nitrososphaera sp.]